MSTTTPSEYTPTIEDVFKAKALLQRVFSGPGVPLEVVDIIIDFAEYWPHTTNISEFESCKAFGGSSIGSPEDKFVYRSLPLGYVPTVPEVTDSFLQPSSIFSTKEPSPIPDFESTLELEAKRSALLERWASRSFPRGENPCRKIVFTFVSKDQGWGGERGCKGTYHGSYSWFDAGLERFEIFPGTTVGLPLIGEIKEKDEVSGVAYTVRTIEPATVPSDANPNIYKFKHPSFMKPPNFIQCNKTATGQTEEHIVTWRYDDAIDPKSEEGKALEEVGRGPASGNGEFVRSLKMGDVVTVWARARFAGWLNNVEDVKVDVYWAV